MEKTLVLLKPDAVKRNLVGEIIQRFEKKGLKIINIKMVQFDWELAAKHYIDHTKEPYYYGLRDFIIDGFCIAMILEGTSCVNIVRKMIGATNYPESLPGTIRGDYSTSTRHNLVHASDSREKAEYEINLFFGEEKQNKEL